MNTPKVSIIVPCWGVEKYLDRCVESLVSQTLKDIEIILVDDESPDRVPEMCDEWASKDDRIKVIHKNNEGQSVARNVGLEKATGDYVAFVDSDDFIELNTYEVMLKECQENDLDVAYFTFDRVDANGKTIFSLKGFSKEIFRGNQETDNFFLNLVGRTPSEYTKRSYTTSASMSLFKADIIRKYHLTFLNVREIASEDLLFSLMFVSYAKAVGNFPYVFYHYLVNEGSTTTSYSDAKYTRMIRCLETIKEICDNRFDKNIYMSHFLSQILRIYKIAMRYETKSNDAFFVKCRKLSSYCCSPWMNIVYNHKDSAKYPIRDRFYIFCMRYRILPFFFFIYR